MTERPILFSAPMVRAILEGRKTQTRRIAKPRRKCSIFDGSWSDAYVLDPGNEEWRMSENPYGVPGDRLWVRETWNAFDGWAGYFYAADDHSFGIGADDDPDHIPEHAIRWRPSIHMPRAASRITLEITEVRVERLNAITGMDARREGVDVPPWIPEDGADLDWARRTFAGVWESIHGPDSWAANPWVWAIGFKRPTAQA